jgi:tetratricopeptide (TPR) repeat protein
MKLQTQEARAILAPFYSKASLDERVSMKVMTEAFDNLRRVFETNDTNEAWSNIRLDHNTLSAEPYCDYLLELKKSFFHYVTETLVTRIRATAEKDSKKGFAEWQAEYATALTWFCDPVYTALCTAEFPFTSEQRAQIAHYRDINRYILDSKWPETWTAFRELADNPLFDATLRSNLKIIEGEVKLYWLPGYKDAIHLFDEAKNLSPENPRVERGYGEYYGRVGEYEQAKNHFLIGISRRPNDIDNYVGMGTVFLSEGNPEAAEQWYRDAMRINFLEAAPYSRIVSLYNTTELIGEHGEEIERYKVFVPKLEMNPDTGNNHYNFLRDLANAYSVAQEFDTSTSYYEQAIALKPELAGAKIDLAYNLAAAKRYDAARDWLIHSLRQDEKWNPDSRWTLGWLYERLGDAEHATPAEREQYYHKAMEEYELCASTRKSWADRCYNLIGILYDRLELDDEAVKYYDRAIFINPTEKVYYNNKLDALRKTRSDPQVLEVALKAVCDRWPDDANAHNALGVFYYEMGDYHSAIVAYTRAIELNPTKAVFFENRGLAYSQLNELEKCEQDYLHSITLDENSEVLNKLGVLSYRREDYQNAIRYYQKAIAADDSHPIYFENLGLAYEQSWKDAEAIVAYRRAIELEKVSGSSANRLGIFYYNRGNNEAAEEYYRVAIEREPNNSIYHVNMGLALERLFRDDEAEQYYDRALSLNPNDAVGKARLAVINMRRGILDDTVYNQLAEVLQSEPNNLHYLEYMGHYLELTKQLKPALEIYERALSIDPDDEYFNNRAGVVLYNMTTPEAAERAIFYYKKAIAQQEKAQFPSTKYLAVYWQNLGLAYEQAGWNDDAERAYLKSIDLDPENDGYLNRIGVFYNNRMADYIQALAYYEKAASIREDPVYFLNMGYAYELLQEHDKASAAYERARVIEMQMGQATAG